MIEADPTLLTARGYLDESYPRSPRRDAPPPHRRPPHPCEAAGPIGEIAHRAGADVAVATILADRAVFFVAASRQARWDGVRDD